MNPLRGRDQLTGRRPPSVSASVSQQGVNSGCPRSEPTLHAKHVFHVVAKLTPEILLQAVVVSETLRVTLKCTTPDVRREFGDVSVETVDVAVFKQVVLWSTDSPQGRGGLYVISTMPSACSQGTYTHRIYTPKKARDQVLELRERVVISTRHKDATAKHAVQPTVQRCTGVAKTRMDQQILL